MKVSALTALAATIGLFFAAAVPPAPTPQPLPDGVSVGARAEPATATVGDLIRIEIEVTAPAGYRVEIPAPPRQAGDFAVLEFQPGPGPADGPPESAPPGATTRHRARAVVAAYRTGALGFPALPVVLHTSEGTKIETSTPGITIKIASVLTDPNPELKPLRRQADIEDPAPWMWWLVAALAAAGILVAAWWIWRKRRTRGEPFRVAPRADPFAAAESRLRALLGLGLIEAGRVKEFYVSLSDIVKQVLEAGYGIQTVEKTTVEILDELRTGRPAAAHPDLEQIESFLSRCDLVKFAKSIPSTAENDAAVRAAFDILEGCRGLRTPAPEPVEAGNTR